MQVQETKNEGLSREFLVTISASDIDGRVDAKLTEIAGTVRLPGFRPGKVPMKLLRQRYGKAVLGEVLEAAVNESTQAALNDNAVKPAMQPKIEVVSFDEGKDLAFKIGVEVLPEIQPMDFSSLALTRLKVQIPADEVETALQDLAKDFRQSEPLADARPSQSGDVVVIDFEGKIDGVAFPGGAATDFQLELGSGRFIPGFEDQLIGKSGGEDLTVAVTFPEEYGAKELAGKPAEFAVKVKEIRVYGEQKIDDEFAKSLGLETLEQLRDNLRQKLEGEYGGAARARLKRDLLDQLHAAHEFDVPGGLLDAEFEAIWSQFEQARERGDIDEEDKAKDEDTLKGEYRDIALRRVKLGLLLSHVGDTAGLEVTQDEVSRAVVAEARRYPGQESAVIKYFQEHPEAMASLRAPILEEKVVDYIVALAKVDDKAVSRDELMAALNEGASASEPEEKKPAKKAKAPAKKKAAKAEEAGSEG